MLSLVVWMHFNQGSIMTVQLTAPMSCGPLRESIAAQPEVERAMCVGDPANVARFVVEGECTTLERRDSYITFLCGKPTPKPTTTGYTWKP